VQGRRAAGWGERLACWSRAGERNPRKEEKDLSLNDAWGPLSIIPKGNLIGLVGWNLLQFKE
jgi:hypothetical protein